MLCHHLGFGPVCDCAVNMGARENVNMSVIWFSARYALFAVIATIFNLSTQRLALFLLSDMSGVVINILIAMLAGTIIGLVVKYLLDKKWIFYDPSDGLVSDGKKFSRYTMTGIVTTAIFWLSETGFWYMFQTDGMRELGAVLGLTIGYIVKYRLDKKFVFGTPNLAMSKTMKDAP